MKTWGKYIIVSRCIYITHELEPESTTQKIRVVRQEGNRMVTRQIDFYNLDMIISVEFSCQVFLDNCHTNFSQTTQKDFVLML
ncbi:MAG: virulence RhuM family protein [Paludibacteraceae bacterium]|nr:virulence RhuM family protein [Paludibacteraceae bacterium]